MRDKITLPKVYDCHVNLSESGKWFNSNLDASYEKILDDLDIAGIEKAVLLAMPGVCSNTAFAASKINRNRFWCFGNLDFSNLNYSLDQIRDLDLDGIKIHPRFQGIGIDVLSQMDFISKLAEVRLPIMICGWQQSSNVHVDALSPLYIDRLAKKHPQLPIILSHMGGYRFWDAYTVARSNPMVYLDCSYFLQAFVGTSLESDFFAVLDKIDRKVIYGSDFPEISIKSDLDYFLNGINRITPTKRDNILFRNLEILMKNKRL